MLKEDLNLKHQQGTKDYIMDFKDILTQLDNMKGDEKKPVVEKEIKRPANMLTESTEIVEPVSNELKLPSLKNVFEELSLEPAKPGAQEIHKDGEPIGSVSNPAVANQMSQAIDKGELTIGQEMQEDEQLDELAPLALLGPALMTGARVAAPWLARRGAQMMSAMGRYAGRNPIKTTAGAGLAGTEQGREFAGNVKDGAVAAVDGVNATFGAANAMIDSGKHMFDAGSAKIAQLGDNAGGMIRNAIGDAAFDTVKRTASQYGLPILAAVALLYGGKKVLDKVMDDDKEETIKEAKDWIAGATKNKGAFTKKAKSHGMTTKAFAKKVLANKDDFPAKTEKQANLAKTLGKFDETDTPPESSLDLTSPISGGNMRESDGSGSYGGQSPLTYDTQRSSKMKEGANMAAQYGPDDGSHNSSNDEKGNAAANAALAANDADTSQLVTEKPKGKVSKSSKLPSISKVKSMCNEGLSTSQIQQLHPKCNKEELTIMIKNTKTNLKEGAEHILKAAKHMGKSHGLCKGSYACPHDAGSEGARAYHEGYKHGLDEACGMGIKNEPIAGMEEGVLGGVGGAIAGSKLGGMAGTAIGGSIGGVPGATIGKAAGAALGGIAGDKMTGDGIFEEPADEVVDTMASYGAMDEAEVEEGVAGALAGGVLGAKAGFLPSIAGTVSGAYLGHKAQQAADNNESIEEAGDDGTYDKYDWDAETVAKKGIDEDEMDEGNAFSGAMAKVGKGDKFSVPGSDKEYTKTSEAAELEEDAWTFESFDKALQSHLVEGKESTKEKLDEGYTMSITSGEENQPDRVSVNATDAEADKLIKFVKDVGLGQYGDAEVVDIEQPEVGDVSFYGSPEVEVEPNGSHDDMLKLMGIVDVDGDYEDEVEAPGTDIDVQVDDAACESCGDQHNMEEGCGDSMKEESDAEMDDHAERAGKEVAHDAHYDGRRHSGRDGEDVTKDLEYDDYKDKHHMEEDQGYDDKEDESLGMRTGKESGKHQSMKDRRDDSYGKFGKRDEEHREISKEGQGYDDKEDESLGMRTGKESDHKQSDKARRDDSYGKFGKRDSEHREKSLEETLSQLDELAQLDEKQGYDDKEDEQLGMKDGKESDKKQSMKDRRDDSRGKFGKRDKEDGNKPHSLEENLRTLDLLAEVGAETSEVPTQPLTQHDDERLLTKEGAEDAPKDSVNDGENEEITETQTDDQREFTVAEDDDLEEGKIPAGLKAYQDKKKGKKDDSEKDVDEACGDMKEEKLDEWANDAGKIGTETSFEQDIDFMTKVISGGLNKQKSTGQTTIPVIAGQNDRMGYNGADVVKEGSVMSHDGLAGLMTKLDSLK